VPRHNLEIVRRSFDAFARGDFDTAFADYHPEIEWCTAADEPDQQTYRGLAGLRVLVATLADPWMDRFGSATEFEDFVDCGDWVVVPWRAQVLGKGSGVPMEISETYAVLVRGGQIVRVDEYRTKEQALEALRLAG
jgi:ketosteroid isomerase-like protein